MTVRTDKEIVEQTEALAVYLLAWGFNHEPETSAPMRDSAHPFAARCWAAACHIQEMLTDTDPENAVAELDDASPVPPSADDLLLRLEDAVEALDGTSVENEKLVDDYRAWRAQSTPQHPAPPVSST